MKAIEHLAQVLESLELEIPCDYLTDLDDVCDKTCSSHTGGKKECWLRYAEAMEKQEQDRWIPVAESLPEEDGEYLVTYESGYAEDYGLDPIGIAPFEADCEGFGIWQESFDPVSLGSLGSEWVDIQVTAWRPLPEAYEAEEKE